MVRSKSVRLLETECGWIPTEANTPSFWLANSTALLELKLSVPTQIIFMTPAAWALAITSSGAIG